MLEVQNLQFAYPEAEIHADFSLARAEVAALMGASGVGKSTVLNLIAGFLTPKHGDIRFDGCSLLAMAPSQRPLSYLLQNHNLFAHLSVYDNLAIGLHPGLRLTRTQNAAVEQALEWVSLSEYASRTPPNLSGGQQQRVGLARCFLRDQPLLLLDEPFSGLDDALRDEMLAHLRALQKKRGMSILITTHQQRDADALDAQVINLAASPQA